MQRLDRILAVIDPTVEIQEGAARAARLARAAGAALELFVCDFDPALSGEPFFDSDTLRTLREKFIAERRADLEKLAAELQIGGLEVTTHVHWDNPLHAGILRRVREFAPDLVVKDTHHHSLIRRTLFTNTDWTLIRKCPVPLLLVKPRAWSAQPRILAALDPVHLGDKPAALDLDILDTARLLAQTLQGSVEAVHAFFPAALLAATTGMAGMPLAPDIVGPEFLDAECKRVTEVLLELAAAKGVGPDAVHVLRGSPIELLPRHAEQAGADCIVMGAVSRTRLQEIFIGSTAERVLDRLPCDVLVVKPGDFGERLPY